MMVGTLKQQQQWSLLFSGADEAVVHAGNPVLTPPALVLHSMRLRVRVRRQTSRVELQGEDPSLTELIQVVRDTVLTLHGLRSVPPAGALLTAVMSSRP